MNTKTKILIKKALLLMLPILSATAVRGETLLTPFSQPDARLIGTSKTNAMKFCNNLSGELQNLLMDSLENEKDDPVIKINYASEGQRALLHLIEEFKVGNITDYLQLASLGKPFQVMQSKSKEPLFFRPEAVLGKAVGIDGKIELFLSAGELRFLSALPATNTPAIVIAQSSNGLTPGRMSAIIKNSLSSQRSIHVIYVGSELLTKNENQTSSAILKELSKSTGGAFVDLSNANPCNLAI